MIDVHGLKRQHAEIGTVIAAAMTAIDRGEVRANAQPITAMLNEMSRLIGSHLKIEDEEVYPVLVNRTEADIRRTARQFRDNMGGLAEEFHNYVARYRSPAAVSADLPLFCYESRRIFERLRYRMQREEHDLYPLLDLSIGAPN
jgi:hypothetical protein